MNAIIMGLQGVLYREYLLASSLKIIDWINKYCKFLILFLPSIALLPFSTDSYDTNDYPFCTMSGVVWNFTVLYGFVWMILLPSLVMVSRTIFKVYRGNPELGNKLFARIGLYYMITLVSWIPRTAYRIIEYMGGHPSLSLYAAAHLITYCCGILYFVIFISERKSLQMFEHFFSREKSVQRDSEVEFGDRDPPTLSIILTESFGGSSENNDICM